jgi:hypothetical protein
LTGVANGLYEYASIASRDVRIVVDASLGVMNGVVAMSGGRSGMRKELTDLLFVLVWVQRDDRWQLTLRQATRIPSIRP